MEVNQATYGTGVATTSNNANKAKETATATNTDNQNATANASTATDVVYDKSKKKNYTVDYDTINKIKSQGDAQLESFRELVRKLLLKQGNTAWQAGEAEPPKDQMIEIDPETRAAAQELVSEDGYFGVEKTSQRLLDFAKAIAGDDPDKIEKMRKAVEKGFKQAEKVWGGELPEISKKTYEAVMKGFDDWAASAASATSATPVNE